MAVLSTYEAVDPGPVADAAMGLLPLRAVYLKARPREAGKLRREERAARAPALPLRGEPMESVVVQEQGLCFRIRPGEGLAVGLYLDTRMARGWVRAHAEARTLLNCFSYTGAFGVAARAGGAMRAVDVDLSRRSLAWAEENAVLNGQAPPESDRLAGDVFEWLRRFSKRGERFDAVVLDPSGLCPRPVGDVLRLARLAGPRGPGGGSRRPRRVAPGGVQRGFPVGAPVRRRPGGGCATGGPDGGGGGPSGRLGDRLPVASGRGAAAQGPGAPAPGC